MESKDLLALADIEKRNEILAENKDRHIKEIDLSPLARFRFSDYVNKYGIAIKPTIFKDIDVSSVSDAIDSEIMYRVLHNVCLTQLNIPDMRYSTYIIDTINDIYDLNLIPDSNDCKLMMDYINDLVNEYSNINIPEYEDFVYLITTFGDGYCNITLFAVGN